MRRAVFQESSVVVTLFAVACAIALGHPVVLLALGVALCAASLVLFWRTAAEGWLLTVGIAGGSALAGGIAWLLG